MELFYFLILFKKFLDKKKGENLIRIYQFNEIFHFSNNLAEK